MLSQNAIHAIVDAVVVFATDLLIPLMVIGFVLGIALRFLIYYTVKREDWFAREFEKRSNHFLEEDHRKQNLSFFMTTKRLLERTFYELFEVRGIMKRRRADHISDPVDRLFLVQHGAAFLVRDTLKQTKFLKFENHTPKFLEISKSVFGNNPCFNRVFGILPIAMFNDLLNILPGIFVIGGIFGTFLGVMKALPELGGMDLADVEGTKAVMDTFLLKISFSMSTSIVGIILSVATTMINTLLSPEKLYLTVVDRFENTLSHLWNRCDSNDLPDEIEHFDEHRDPVEALATLAVQKELDSGGPGYYKRYRELIPGQTPQTARQGNPPSGYKSSDEDKQEASESSKKDAA